MTCQLSKAFTIFTYLASPVFKNHEQRGEVRRRALFSWVVVPESDESDSRRWLQRTSLDDSPEARLSLSVLAIRSRH